MAVDTQQILSEAEKLGQLVAQHPAVAKYKAAQKSITDDPDAGRLLADFDRQLESLARQEQSGMPVTDAQRMQLENLQTRIVSHIKIKALNMAQVEFMDLLRRTVQTIQRPLADTAGAAPLSSNPRSEPDPMAYWLLKTEPGCYAWDDLVREKKTTWNGVSNALALKHIRTMKKGDLALIYHTADERAAIGIAEIVSNPHPDPSGGDDRLTAIDLKPRKKLDQPVTLSDFKADKTFQGWDLLRIGRLSVVPVPEAMWNRVLELARRPDHSMLDEPPTDADLAPQDIRNPRVQRHPKCGGKGGTPHPGERPDRG